MSETFELIQEPEDSDRRFSLTFEDMHILKQWPIVQQVTINDDIGYMRYLISSFSPEAVSWLMDFIRLFLRAVENDN